MTLNRERFFISPFFVFFTIHGAQIGIGVLSFQRRLNEKVGHDGWISVIVAGIVAHLLIWMMYQTFQRSGTSKDVIQLNVQYFGKWIGNALNIGLVCYFLLLALIVLRLYIEVVQVWMFPLMGTWQFSLILLLLTYYTVLGGFRSVVGLCVWGVLIPLFTLFPMLFFPLEYAHYRNFFPIFDHSVIDVLKGAKEVTVEYLGFELLFMYYPFIKHGQQSHRWAQWANGFTMLIYLVIIFISTVFYNEEQVKHVIWPTLTLGKIPEIPFIERMEYIIISIYVLVVFPIICLAIWSVTRGLKRMFSLKQCLSLPVVLIAIFIASLFFNTREEIDQLGKFVSTTGFYLVIGYIPFLYLLSLFMKRLKGKASMNERSMI